MNIESYVVKQQKVNLHGVDIFYTHQLHGVENLPQMVWTLVVVVVVGQTVGPISSKMLAYDSLYTLELCKASMIALLLFSVSFLFYQCLSLNLGTRIAWDVRDVGGLGICIMGGSVPHFCA